jgi:putative tryptophan/tyrosine transport system substrate-binding protein
MVEAKLQVFGLCLTPTSLGTMVYVLRPMCALVIGTDAFFNSQNEQLAVLTRRHSVPAIYQFREFVLSGGLASFGTTVVDTYRPLGVYTGRILKGEKPADLPVPQATKLLLIINMKTACALCITVPLQLLGRADEVIE